MTRHPFQRLVDRFRRRGKPQDTTVPSPRQMALENAADALGEELGDYYVDEWEVPKHELLDAERLVPSDVRARVDAQREEMVLYLRRRSEHRRRRRVRVVSAGIGVTAIVAIGIAALVTSGSEKAPDPGRLDLLADQIPPSMRGSGAPDSPAPAGNRVTTSASAGGTKFVATSYVGFEGGICTALVYVRDGVGEQRTRGGCPPAKYLSRHLRRFHVVIDSLVGHADATVLRGYASREVEAVGGPQWKHGLDSGLSALWAPWAAGIDPPLPRMRPFKAFIALATVEVGKRVMGTEGYKGDSNEMFGLTARLSDGRVVPVKGYHRIPE